LARRIAWATELLLGMRNIAAIGRSLAQHHAAHRIEMQISAHFQQIFVGLNDRTLESALKQMPEY
jgi:hypothetical protein